MKTIYIKAILLAFLLVGFASCKKDAEVPPAEDLNLYLSIDYRFDAQTLKKDSLYIAENRPLNFKELYFYLSNISLKTDTGYFKLHNLYHLCFLGKSDYSLGELKKLNICAIKFDVGVDSVANAGDPSLYPESHPLSLNHPISLHWGWNTGYIFALFEGKFDNSISANQDPQTDWIYHIGLNQFLMKNIEIPVSNIDGKIKVVFDASGIFRNINLIDENLTTSTFNTTLASKISQNIRNNVFKKVE
jgi:hypothetical protein